MKPIAYLAPILLFTLVVGCQKETPASKDASASEKSVAVDTAKNTTKLQEFLGKRGTLIVKDFYRLGTINGILSTRMEFNAVVFYEPGKEQERIRGLKIEVSTPRSYGENTETAFLDLEELESLAQAVKYMNELNRKWASTPKEYTEVIFETRGNFKAGFYKNQNEVKPFASAGYGSGSSCFFNKPEDLSLVSSKIQAGIDLLKTK